MRRSVRGITMAVMAVAVAASPAFAQVAQPVWVDVNVGAAIPAEDTFRIGAVGVIDDEDATFGGNYNLPTGFLFDFGAGVMITPMFGVGASFSRSAHKDVVDLDVDIPHPLFFDAHASDTAPTDEDLERSENALHIQASFVPVNSDTLRVRIFGGPSFFRVRQDVVNDIFYDQTFGGSPNLNTVEITSFDSVEVEESGWGFNVGADVSTFFTDVVGVGGFARYSRANIDIENALATTIGFDDTVEIKAGGFVIGAGLRLRF